MSRQINSDIFNENATLPGFEALPAANMAIEAQAPDPRLEELIQEVERIKYDFKELVRTLNLRMEKIAQKFQHIDESMKHTAQESYERISHLSSKIKETGSSELKAEAMMQRHNQVLQNYELRLNQALRLIDNQSLQLAKQAQVLDDAKRQIEKLKKL